MNRIIAVALTIQAFCGFSAVAGAQENIDCGYPVNQMEMTFCAQKGWQEADADLNAVYKEAMAAMKETDSYLPDDMKGAATALRDAQRAWIPYRDKACEAYGFQARGGSMEPMLIYGCLATMTRQRVEELKDLAGGLEN
jgi:uncharacterized protein YecT (DUF1311 family)